MKTCLRRLLACALSCVLFLGALPMASAAKTPFTDVPSAHWAADSISQAVELGFFQGESRSRFGLGHKMTRGAFTVVLCRFFDWEMVQPKESTFQDVKDPSRWYWSAVETAYANGALTRQTDSFRPNDPITREEMAVMLVRALGYGSIAGLAQNLKVPFQDLHSNAGYVAMAYELGIMNGTSKTTFSPDRTATREQVAVTLIRLYERTHKAPLQRMGILNAPGSLEGFSLLAIPAGHLTFNGAVQLAAPMSEQQAAALRDSARKAGAKALLHVSGDEMALKGTAHDTANLLSQAVSDGGYDGLFLDLTHLKYPQRKAFTELIQTLDHQLGKQLLYISAEAPVLSGPVYDGYSFSAISAAADGLVLRVPSRIPEKGDFPIAPLEPLEDVYYALAQLRDLVPMEKVCLMLTSTGSAWISGKQDGTRSAQEIAQLLSQSSTQSYYSDRYACAYLSAQEEDSPLAIWYLDGEAVAQRLQMAQCFQIGGVCLSDVSSLSSEVQAVLSR